ncbi:hypothetical protein E2C01_051324 [Portunus trituberculatus]|uniref:Uncharacterized protein n=1 Tax=Portunus trituberculatus TaxID=210409 RepID=A0A5B7GID2_PORTR|nr:hypothetical protein [Portunus trituberculatus]
MSFKTFPAPPTQSTLRRLAASSPPLSWRALTDYRGSPASRVPWRSPLKKRVLVSDLRRRQAIPG